MNNDNLVIIIVMPVMFALYAWIGWLIVNWRKLKHKSLLHQKLLERFQSAVVLQSFLQSEAGERFLQSFKLDSYGSREKILSTLSWAAVISLVGVTATVLSFFWTEYAKIFLSIGLVIIALGAGLFISAALSVNLGKKWGLFDK
jgi:ABC-type multidrug transport system fused ATPase/permease subunit